MKGPSYGERQLRNVDISVRALQARRTKAYRLFRSEAVRVVRVGHLGFGDGSMLAYRKANNAGQKGERVQEREEGKEQKSCM